MQDLLLEEQETRTGNRQLSYACMSLQPPKQCLVIYDMRQKFPSYTSYRACEPQQYEKLCTDYAGKNKSWTLK